MDQNQEDRRLVSWMLDEAAEQDDQEPMERNLKAKKAVAHHGKVDKKKQAVSNGSQKPCSPGSKEKHCANKSKALKKQGGKAKLAAGRPAKKAAKHGKKLAKNKKAKKLSTAKKGQKRRGTVTCPTAFLCPFLDVLSFILPPAILNALG